MTDEFKFLLQALISAGAAFLAAHLAGRRFRTEKWWERKAEAYAELVEALHEMQWPASELIEAEFEGRSLPEEDSAELRARFRDARKTVWRIADASDFLVSPKVREAVQRLERGLGAAESASGWFDHLDTQIRAVGECLETIKRLGRTELRVPGDRD